MYNPAIRLLLLFQTLIKLYPPPPPGSSFRITDDGSFRITDAGDYRITD